jgi:putative heme transporter
VTDPRPRRTGRAHSARLVLHAAGVALGCLCLALVLPTVSGAPWRAVVAALTSVPLGALAALVVLWAAGLVVHTVALTAALPGLTHRRALLLSLTGSAVANVLPLGGAAGIALNYKMTRRWGFTPTRFAASTGVSHQWDVLAKLALPALLVPVVLLGLPVSPGLEHVVLAAAVALPVVAALAGLLLTHPRAAARLGHRVEQVRRAAATVVADAWGRLSFGMAAYTLLLLALLEACLRVTDAGVPWPVVLLAFCAERLATLVGLTPGGLGLVEVGLAGALVLAPGADPAGVAAGVLVYRALTFGLEIPVGGVLLAGWSWRQRAARPVPA